GLCRQGLEDGHEPIRYSLRGSVYSIIRVNLKPALNTEILTPPPVLTTVGTPTSNADQLPAEFFCKHRRCQIT
ncbi:hypothetical protein ACUHMQ_21390, partial [Chitinimonas sp. PSY-7]|uniref:hypothetical protein n=1 Tax=Chitinimonas sp. PSY-7 TaxID=3459088 RepID=UPI0040403B4E